MISYVHTHLHQLWGKVMWEGGAKKRWSKEGKKGKKGERESKFFCVHSIYL